MASSANGRASMGCVSTVTRDHAQRLPIGRATASANRQPSCPASAAPGVAHSQRQDQHAHIADQPRLEPTSYKAVAAFQVTWRRATAQAFDQLIVGVGSVRYSQPARTSANTARRWWCCEIPAFEFGGPLRRKPQPEPARVSLTRGCKILKTAGPDPSKSAADQRLATAGLGSDQRQMILSCLTQRTALFLTLMAAQSICRLREGCCRLRIKAINRSILYAMATMVF